MDEEINKQNEVQEGTESATGILIATYIFAFLGGLLGVVLGIVVFKNKKYLPSHRKLALLGAILAAISFGVWSVIVA